MAKRANIAVFLYLLLILVIYILTINTSFIKYQWDSVEIASWADKGKYVVPYQQHHMLITGLNLIWCNIWKFFGYNGRCLMPLRFLNCIFGAVGVTGFFILLSKIFRKVITAVFGSLGLAFSIYYWAFSTDAEVHILPISIFIYCLILLFSFEEFKIKKVILLGFLHSLCIYLAGIYVFFVPAIIAGIIINIGNRQNIYKALIWYLFSLAMFWAIPFFVIGIYHYGINSGLKYSNDIARHIFIWFRTSECLIPLRWYNLFNARVAFCYFCTIHYINRCDGLTIFWGFIAIILYLLFLPVFLKNSKEMVKNFSKLLLIVFCMIIPYQFITIIYHPFNAERYVYFLPALWLLLSFIAYPFFTSRLTLLRILPFILIGFIFFTNLLFYIYPRHLNAIR